MTIQVSGKCNINGTTLNQMFVHEIGNFFTWIFVFTGEAPTEQLGKQIGMDLTPLEPELIDTMIGEEEEAETGEFEIGVKLIFLYGKTTHWWIFIMMNSEH